MATTRSAAERAVTGSTLVRIRHPELRADAEAALARGEAVRLVEGGAEGARVETVVVGGGRAGQSAGGHVIRGVWTGARLAADAGGHLLDADGVCFCRDCEAAQGYCVDDDE
jgi:hypothetical protein